MLEAVVSESASSEWTEFTAEQHGVKVALHKWCSDTGTPLDDHIVPIGIWGDSAPFTARDSLNICLWNCLSGTHRERFMLTGFPKSLACRCGCKGRYSEDAVEVLKSDLDTFVVCVGVLFVF